MHTGKSFYKRFTNKAKAKTHSAQFMPQSSFFGKCTIKSVPATHKVYVLKSVCMSVS